MNEKKNPLVALKLIECDSAPWMYKCVTLAICSHHSAPRLQTERAEPCLICHPLAFKLVYSTLHSGKF